MSVTIRRARKGDEDRVAEFAMKLFAQHREYDPERFADLSNIKGAAWYYGSRSEAEKARVFVAELDGHVVGYAYLEYEEKDYMELLENAVRLHDIYVNEAARGMGAGRALMRAVREAAIEFGADKVVLTVSAKNAHSRRFFASGGFRETMVEMTLGVENDQFND